VAALCGRLLLLADGPLLPPAEQSELERLLGVSPALALEWTSRASSGEDRDLRLTALLFAWARHDFSAAWIWAGTQKDMLAGLAVLSSASDQIAAALLATKWVAASPADDLYRVDYLSRLWRELGRHEANLAFAESLPPEHRAILLQTALEHYSRHRPEHALRYALDKDEPAERESALLAVVAGWPEDRLPDLRRLRSALDVPAVALLAEHRLASAPAP
jgi:hypothetical protein